MAKPRVCILKTAGVNCDKETAFAFEAAGASTEFVHINELVAQTKKLRDYQILALSGGFTYGDDIAAGKILANELKFKLFDDVRAFIDAKNLIIGICNGFQVLVRAGILPGNINFSQEATLSLNDCGLFQDKWVYLSQPCGKEAKSERKCVWTKGIEKVIYLPIAHAEGKFIPASEDVLEKMRAQGQIVFQYSDRNGNLDNASVNPNGSIDNIAGICDETGRIFGLMPHPERYLIGLQHPSWTREGLKERGDGFAIFSNGVNYFK
ncbi:MAG: phosphoribosylformylglycinamidine synthase I [Candidatus Omnitrophota bacterium]